MLLMLPNYTLERLQETDIDLLLPLYFWFCRQNGEEKTAPQKSGIIYRGGKPYVVKKADEIGNIF